MPVLDSEIVEHRLPLKLECSPVKQKLRRTHLDMVVKIKEEVQKQIDVVFLVTAEYPLLQRWFAWFSHFICGIPPGGSFQLPVLTHLSLMALAWEIPGFLTPLIAVTSDLYPCGSAVPSSRTAFLPLSIPNPKTQSNTLTPSTTGEPDEIRRHKTRCLSEHTSPQPIGQPVAVYSSLYDLLIKP
ncbi:hypothetical protein KIW84_024916 [Lathyrus oleraceus]|uniref:Uncharacterized protein n=1 Tax=Pisum sativum TaxID=3888 RepID=A0A9D4YHP4_PEA|nr:hypothetical protein KIW84_024916 [Pisum sativum]